MYVGETFFIGILITAVIALNSASVRPPNYSTNEVPEMSITYEDKITYEARFRYGVE